MNINPQNQDTIPEAESPVTLLALVIREDSESCARWIKDSHLSDVVHDVSQLSEEQRARLIELLPSEQAAELLERLPMPQAVEGIEGIETSKAAEIIEQLHSDDQADLIAELDDEDAQRIIGQLDEAVAENLRRLAAYAPDSAGGLMVTEYLAYTRAQSIQDVLDDMERNATRYAKFNVQYTYVINELGVVIGVLPIRRLMLAPRDSQLESVMIPDPITINEETLLDDFQGDFSEHDYIGFPVVDATGRLQGVLERSAFEHALSDQADSLYRQTQGIVGGEELRSMPVLLRAKRRLMWLSSNIGLNLVAASVIAMHQDTIEAVIALAVFLPIISDMSGCSGNQAVAVSMRELTLGVARPSDIYRVIFKEASVGIINGIVLGLIIGLVAFAWKGNPYLGGVVGLALMLNTVIAVMIGGSVPLVLKGLKLDPALASGPILTTVTDLCGFLLVLTLASNALDYLQ